MKIYCTFTLLAVLAVAQACGKGDPQKLERKCAGGEMEACKDLGVMYVKGERIEKNIARAAEFLQIYCDGGFEDDCSVLKPIYVEVYNKHGYLLHSIYKDLNKPDNPLLFYPRALASCLKDGNIPLPPQKADYDDEISIWQNFKNKLGTSDYTKQLVPSRENLSTGINDVLDNLKRNSQVYVEGMEIKKEKLLNKADEINKLNVRAEWLEYLEKSVPLFCDSLKTLPPHIQSKINWDCSEMNNFEISAFAKSRKGVSTAKSAQTPAGAQAESGAGAQAAAAGKTAGKGEAGIDWVFSKPANIYFGRSEVTVTQFGKCVSAGVCEAGHHQPASDDKECNLDNPDRLNHPMNCVDWYGADAYCKWAGGRLPTEKEWFAEAGNNKIRKYPWGGREAACDYAVMNDGSDGCGLNSSSPVCSKPAGNSVSGLCDMSGNVWEWTSTEAGKDRILRGGSWATSKQAYLRTTSRLKDDPSFSGSHSGFRCAKASR